MKCSKAASFRLWVLRQMEKEKESRMLRKKDVTKINLQKISGPKQVIHTGKHDVI